jgi:hypothetical protein
MLFALALLCTIPVAQDAVFDVRVETEQRKWLKEAPLKVFLKKGSELYTNRRHVRLSYGYVTQRGKSVRFLPRYHELPPDAATHTFELGGELIPDAWAEVLLRKSTKSPESWSLVWEAGLQTPRGDHLDEEESEIEWEAYVRTQDGSYVPSGPLGVEDREELSQRQGALEVDVRYVLGSRRQHSKS